MVKEVLKGPEVCKDPARLCTYAVGVNVLKQGEDPTIKPKEEYPEWYECVFYFALIACQISYNNNLELRFHFVPPIYSGCFS